MCAKIALLGAALVFTAMKRRRKEKSAALSCDNSSGVLLLISLADFLAEEKNRRRQWFLCVCLMKSEDLSSFEQPRFETGISLYCRIEIESVLPVTLRLTRSSNAFNQVNTPLTSCLLCNLSAKMALVRYFGTFLLFYSRERESSL